MPVAEHDRERPHPVALQGRADEARVLDRDVCVVDERLVAVDDGVAGDPQRERSVVDPVRAVRVAIAVDPPVVERVNPLGRPEHADSMHGRRPYPLGSAKPPRNPLTGMDLQLLGPAEATVQGRPIPLGATKQRALLAMLALRANASVSIDSLIGGLWAGDPPASAAKMVQLYVSQLRRLIDGNGA